MNKRRKRLAHRWLDYCDRVAYRLLDERQIPPGRRGMALLLTAISLRVGSLLYPKWLSDLLQRRALERNVQVDATGFGKVTEFLESVATSMMYKLQAVGTWCYQLVVPEKLLQSTERAVVAKSVDTYWSIRNLAERLAKRFIPAWLRTRLRAVSDVLSIGYVFSLAWVKSREWTKLAWSLPAVLLSLPLVGAVAASLVYLPSQKIQHYQRALADAVESRDEQAEQVYIQKLSQLGYGQLDRAEYQSAYALSLEDGKWDEAVKRMQLLAPADEPGFAHAHLWLADNLLRGKIESPDRWKLIETHASHALELSAVRNREARNAARLFLARAKGRRGEVVQALDEMAALAEDIPTLHFELLQHALATGDLENARRYARKVISVCEDMEAESGSTESNLVPYHYLAWAAAKQLWEGPAAAEQVLRQANKQFPLDLMIRTQLASIISTPLRRADLEDAQTMELLKEVFRLDPANADATTLLSDSAGASAETVSVVRAVTETLIQDDLMPVRVCLKLGDTRWAQQDSLGAVWYYERAAEIDPTSAAAWNNVAWLRGCVDETEDLQSALLAVNRAIELDDDPRCFETRGQIYAKLERWEEAISDLERAVNGSLPNSRPAHESLAKALAAVGDEEAAAAHRLQAERLK